MMVGIDDRILTKVVVTDRALVRGPLFDEAQRTELQSWMDKAIYIPVEYTGQELITTTWVYTLKTFVSGTQKAKARLVARGFQDPMLADVDGYAPTVARSTLQLLLAVIAAHGWLPHTIDVTTAFLNAKPLDRAVYLPPPSEAGERKEIV